MKKIRLMILLAVLLAMLAFAQSASAAVTLGDGGFELGSANPYWSASSSLGFDIIYQGGNARSGNWFAFLGGAAGIGEVGKVSQDFKLPKNGVAYLTFWLRVGMYDPAGSDKLLVIVDGDKLLKIAETDGWAYGSYQQITVNIDAYLDGGAHTLTFKGTDKAGGNTAWYVDDVAIQFDGIVNGSMEIDSNGDKVPDGWKISSSSGQTRRVCDVAYAGSCSVRLPGTGGTEQLIYTWKPGTTGKAGDTNWIYFRALGSGFLQIWIYVTRSDGVELPPGGCGYGGPYATWETGGCGWTSSVDYKKVRIVIENTAAGTMWIDTVSLTQTGGPVPAPQMPDGPSLTGE